MKKTLLYLSIFISLGLALFSRQVQAVSVAGASAELVDQKALKNDIRIEKLTLFLEYYKSPLAEYAEDFVISADKYGVDWRLLPAISGVESTFAKNYIEGTYNAYGWGGGKIYFDSWEDSIEKINQALSEKYYRRGLDSPAKIAPVYCPPSRVWAGNVTYFMTKLENFEPEIDLGSQLISSL